MNNWFLLNKNVLIQEHENQLWWKISVQYSIYIHRAVVIDLSGELDIMCECNTHCWSKAMEKPLDIHIWWSHHRIGMKIRSFEFYHNPERLIRSLCCVCKRWDGSSGTEWLQVGDEDARRWSEVVSLGTKSNHTASELYIWLLSDPESLFISHPLLSSSLLSPTLLTHPLMSSQIHHSVLSNVF